MAKKTYQVWHDTGWPQSRINQMLGGWPPSRFPEDYVHVANVQANGLREVVALTTDKGSILEGTEIPWERNRGIENLGHPRIKQRDTDRGDVIVDPQGNAYRVEQNGFSEIVGGNQRQSYDQLLAEKAALHRGQGQVKGRGIER
jgi:hypothetical protein